MIAQLTVTIPPQGRGFHLITDEILRALGELPDFGMLNLFIQHTSAGLTINENADPAVLVDFERYFNHIVPEELPGLTHTLEGPDDMPSHIKSTLCGPSLTIPIRKGKLHLGRWQGIYFCEFRNHPRERTILATVYS